MLRAFYVRKNWLEIERRLEEDKRRSIRVMLLVLVISIVLVAFFDRLPLSVALSSFLSEAASLCLYPAVLVWYALRRRPEARKMALLAYAFLVAMMAATDWLTKAGLSVLLADSERVTSPALYAGILMMGIWPLLIWFYRRYPAEFQAVGLNPSGLPQQFLYGLGTGLAMSLHFAFTLSYAMGAWVVPKPWPFIIWHSSYEFGIQSISEELFFRSLFFNYFYNVRHWGFWAAALTSSALNVLIYVSKVQWSANLMVAVVVIFYVFIISTVSALLYRWTDSVVPGFLSNACISMMFFFRG